jgi:integrase
VDLETGTLRVRRALAQTDDGPVLAAPKSAKSRRRIKLTGAAVEALKRHRAAQNTERLGLGGLWEDRGLVFPNRTGGFLSPYLLTDGPLKRPLERAGLPQIRFHDLRHEVPDAEESRPCSTLLAPLRVGGSVIAGLSVQMVPNDMGVGICL